MNAHSFQLAGTELEALPSGALWWPEQHLLCVSDLHLGKSERMARRSGALLPPYETLDTLQRLDAEVSALNPKMTVCLGDSFDDLQSADALPEDVTDWIKRLAAGRQWIWIEGNHDPGPLDLPGSHVETLSIGPLTFRHIADPLKSGELSGHYHPKLRMVLRGRMISRPCFLRDASRVILPAFGTYTGGLAAHAEPLASLMDPGGTALLTGPRITELPLRVKARS